MPIVEKEIIRPAQYWYADRTTGLPQRFECTPELVQHMCSEGKDMLSAGLSIPIPLEHDEDCVPMKSADLAARKLLNNTGEIKDFEVREIEENGKKIPNVLFGKMDIQDDAVAKKLGKTIKWGSPWIHSFDDPTGKRREGVITHYALTSRPRIVQQAPFQSIAAAMSLSPALNACFSLATLPKTAGLIVCRQAQLIERGGKLAPRFPSKFSAMFGIQLSEEDKLKEKDDDYGEDMESEIPEAAPEGGEGTLVDGEGMVEASKMIAHFLEEHDIHIELGDGDLKNALLKGLMACAKGKCDDESVTDPKMKRKDQPIVQESPPMMMSLEDANKIEDPGVKSIALSLIEQTAKNQRLEANLFKAAEAKRLKRIEAIFKLTKDADLKTELETDAKSAKFSLSDAGEVVDSMEMVLSRLERMSKNLKTLPALLNLRLSGAEPTEHDHPLDYKGKMSEETRKETVNELAKAAGLVTAKA